MRFRIGPKRRLPKVSEFQNLLCLLSDTRLDKNLRTETSEIEEGDKKFKVSKFRRILITTFFLDHDHLQCDHETSAARCC
jgi:hypothetical protein